jgi:hypothetical protein
VNLIFRFRSDRRLAFEGFELPIFSRLIQVLMRLTLGVFAAVAVLSLLALGLVMLLLALLRALVTGQRPAAVTAFSRFRQLSGQQMAGRWGGAPVENYEDTNVTARTQRPAPATRSRLGSEEVEDVEVREISTERPPR